MKKLLFLVLLSIILLPGCSSNKIGTKKLRGNLQQTEWFAKYLKEEIVQKKASPNKAKNYSLKVHVLVAEEDQKGDSWDKGERGEFPDIILYHIENNGSKHKLGSKDDSLTLFSEYPLNLKGEDTVILRVVDKDQAYSSYTYGSKYNNDRSSENSSEYPLAQLNLVFKGQGRYLYFTGSVLLIIDFIELTHIRQNTCYKHR